jgi:polyribonucleotide nucleotidyltransferase
MDAGVPIKAPVAGVAMGLITGDSKHAVLTDIEGLEDAYGDMDFKVAGTTEGITALQLDIKLKGVDMAILQKALGQSTEARQQILGVMQQTISSSRSEISRHAPRMYKINIPADKIGSVIGSGGKTIRSIIEETKASVDIQDDGTAFVGSPDEESARKAIAKIEELTREVEVGSTYTGKVTRILGFGAMVEVLPGKEGLVHVSELAEHRVASVEDVVKVGDEITVKVIGIDHMGRVNLSRRAVLETVSRGGGARTNDYSASDYPAKRERQFRPAPRSYGNRGRRYPRKQ